MKHFDDDFDQEETDQDNDLYLEFDRKDCTSCNGTGNDPLDGRLSAECLGAGIAGKIY